MELNDYNAGYADGIRAGREGRLAEAARIAAAEKRGRVAGLREAAEIAEKLGRQGTRTAILEWAEEVEKA